MIQRWHLMVSVLFVATGIAACGRNSPAPTSPSPVAPVSSTPPAVPPTPPVSQPPSGPTVLAGTVSDAAYRRLPGARVQVTNGVSAGLSTLTAANGEFRLSGDFDERTIIRATIDGHTAVSMPFPPECLQCNPHRWLHFTLESLAPHADLTGDWTLTIVADAACRSSFSDEERTRTYEAAIEPRRPSTSEYSVSVRPPAFLVPYFGPVSFMIGTAGDHTVVSIGDAGHDGAGLYEETSPGTFLTINGELAVSVPESRPSTISGSFAGTLERCTLTMPWGFRYSCSEAGSTARARCQSRAHRLTLARR